MAEAFYQSISGPFQLLIVGDPLCQPFAAIPEVTVQGVADGQFVTGDVEIAPAAKVAPGRSVGHFELFVDGVRSQSRGAGQHLILDTTKLGDGYHELRVVAVDASPIEVQGRWIGGVMVKNGRDAVELTAVVDGTDVVLNVTASIDGAIGVYHNGRELGRTSGRQGRLTVAADKLGKGPVVLQARTIGTPALSSRPLRLEIL